MKTVSKLLFALTIMTILAVAPAAVADTITFHTQNDSSSWSYGGGSSNYTGTATNASLGTVQLNSGPALTIANMTVSVVTGAGTVIDASTVNFSSGGSSFTITGNVGFGVETLFSGILASPSLIQLGTGGSGATAFSANFVLGQISANALNFVFGTPGHVLSTMNGSFSSTNTGIVNTVSGGSGLITGSTTTLNSVPEPASLALLGSGMLMGGNFVRRKIAMNR